MNDEDKIKAVKFKPRARLLIQLGDQLIKNESIALVELVKNSYDADATEVKISMENVDDIDLGVIIIEDNGFGMTPSTVEDVWLEPGSDFKSEQIKNNQGSPKFNRLPIGEKGIGRFGVHKLGNIIELTTKSRGQNEVFVKIDWQNFDDYKYLDQVPIKIIERVQPQYFTDDMTGTHIVIRSLRKKWERGTARDVKRSINALISPFDGIGSFKAEFDIIDKPVWFEGLMTWEKIKEFSLYHFKIKMSDDKITEFNYQFTPWASMPKLSEKEVSLKEKPATNEEKLVQNFKKLEYVENKKRCPLSLSENKLNIGEVTFEGYIFDLDSYILSFGVTDKKGYKDYLKSNGGIKVFRDGLRVYDYGEPENDWLDLDFRRFQMPSKSISNNLVIGTVSVKRESSKSLVEKTNREGFVENAAYLAFKRAILHCIDIVESLRLIDKKRLRSIYGPTPKSEPVIHIINEAKQYALSKIKEQNIRKQIVSYLSKIEEDYKRINETLLKAAGAGLSMSVVIHEVEKIIFEVEKVLKAEKGSDRALNLVKHLSSLIDGYADIVRKSSQTNEDIKKIIDQALFNTEYRLASHKIEVIREYKNYNGYSVSKIARSLLVGSIMNLIDNSIFWLEKAYSGNNNLFKKIWINITSDDRFLYLILSDNGTGFLLPTDTITEPFISAKPGGMGLGLHIISEIILAQKGRLIFPDQGDFSVPNEFQNGATIVLAFIK